MLFGLLTLACALFVSAIAAWYSVIGLMAIFAASPLSVALMGSSLELAKIVTASWLYRNWYEAPKLLKYYFTFAVVILMLITSLGIFGFLSKAHVDQSLISSDAVSKVEIIDEKIRTARETIDANRKALKQLDESVDQIMARSTTEEGARRASSLRISQKSERTRIASEIETQQKIIAKLNEDRQPFAVEVKKLEAEVGPIKYIAALLYDDQVTQTMLENAVRWVIILIVLVFDPLAVLLIIAANYSISRHKKNKETPFMNMTDVASNIKEDFAKGLDKIKKKKEKVDLTSLDPIPMDKEEIEKKTKIER